MSDALWDKALKCFDGPPHGYQEDVVRVADALRQVAAEAVRTMMPESENSAERIESEVQRVIAKLSGVK